MSYIEKFPAGFNPSMNHPLDSRQEVLNIATPDQQWLETAYVGLSFFNKADSKNYRVTATDGTLIGLRYEPIGDVNVTQDDKQLLTLEQIYATPTPAFDFSANPTGNASAIHKMFPYATLWQSHSGNDLETLITSSGSVETIDTFITLPPGMYNISYVLRVNENDSFVSFSSEIVNAQTNEFLNDKVLTNNGEIIRLSALEEHSFNKIVVLEETTDVSIGLVPSSNSSDTSVRLLIRDCVILEMDRSLNKTFNVDTFELFGDTPPTGNDQVAVAKTTGALTNTARYRQTNLGGAGLWLCVDKTQGSHGKWERLITESDVHGREPVFLRQNAHSDIAQPVNFDLINSPSNAIKIVPGANLVESLGQKDIADFNLPAGSAAVQDGTISLDSGRYTVSFTLSIRGIGAGLLVGYSPVIYSGNTVVSGSPEAGDDIWIESGIERHHSMAIELTSQSDIHIGLIPHPASTDIAVSLVMYDFMLQELPGLIYAPTSLEFADLTGSEEPNANDGVASLKTSGGLRLNHKYTQSGVPGTGMWLCVDPNDGTHGKWDKLITHDEVNGRELVVLSQGTSSPSSGVNFDLATTIANAVRIMPGADLMHSLGQADIASFNLPAGNSITNGTVTLNPGRYEISFSLSVTGVGAYFGYTPIVLNGDTQLTNKTLNNEEFVYLDVNAFNTHVLTFELTEVADINVGLLTDTSGTDTSVAIELGDFTVKELPGYVYAPTVLQLKDFTGPEVPTSNAEIAEALTNDELALNTKYTQSGVAGSGLWLCIDPAYGTHGKWEKLLTESEVKGRKLLYISQHIAADGFSFNLDVDGTVANTNRLFPPAARMSIFSDHEWSDAPIIGTNLISLDNRITLKPGTYNIAFRIQVSGISGQAAYTADIVRFDDRESVTGKPTPGTAQETLCNEEGSSWHDFVFTLTEEETVCIGIIPDTSTTDTSITLQVQDLSVRELPSGVFVPAFIDLLNLEGPGIPQTNASIAVAKVNGELTLNTKYTQTNVTGAGLWLCIDPDFGTHGKWEKLVTKSEILGEHERVVLTQINRTSGMGIDMEGTNNNLTDAIRYFPRPDRMKAISSHDLSVLTSGTALSGVDNSVVLPAGIYEFSWNFVFSEVTPPADSNGSSAQYSADVVNAAGESLTGRNFTQDFRLDGNETSFHKFIVELTESTSVSIALIPEGTSSDDRVVVLVNNLSVIEQSLSTFDVTNDLVATHTGTGTPDASPAIELMKAQGRLEVGFVFRDDSVLTGSALWQCLDAVTGTHGRWARLEVIEKGIFQEADLELTGVNQGSNFLMFTTSVSLPEAESSQGRNWTVKNTSGGDVTISLPAGITLAPGTTGTIPNGEVRNVICLTDTIVDIYQLPLTWSCQLNTAYF